MYEYILKLRAVIHAELASGWPQHPVWLIGFVDDGGELAAMTSVVRDVLARGV